MAPTEAIAALGLLLMLSSASQAVSEGLSDSELLQRLQTLEAACSKLHQEAAQTWSSYLKSDEFHERLRLQQDWRNLMKERSSQSPAEAAALHARGLGLQLKINRMVKESPHLKSLLDISEGFDRLQQEAQESCMGPLLDRQELLQTVDTIDAEIQEMNKTLTSLRAHRHRFALPLGPQALEQEVKWDAVDALFPAAEKAINNLWQDREKLLAAAAAMTGEQDAVAKLKAHLGQGLQKMAEILSDRADLHLWSLTLRNTSLGPRIHYVKGNTDLSRPGQAAATLPSLSEAPLARGDRLRTGKDGYICLGLSGVCSIEIGPQSDVQLDSDEEARFTLLYGMAHVAGPCSIRIESADATFESDQDLTVIDPFLTRSPEEKHYPEVLLPAGTAVLAERGSAAGNKIQFQGPLRLPLAETILKETLPDPEPRRTLRNLRGIGAGETAETP